MLTWNKKPMWLACCSIKIEVPAQFCQDASEIAIPNHVKLYILRAWTSEIVLPGFKKILTSPSITIWTRAWEACNSSKWFFISVRAWSP